MTRSESRADASPHCLEQLSDKVVLVTGASSGLGRDYCLELAKAGCRIVAAARRIDRLKSLCDEINGQASDPRAVAVELDVSGNRTAIEAAVNKAWDAFGRVDALINNAGVRGKLIPFILFSLHI
ncbi:3-oxoacyl-[acyl-carrier-protein] reductase FabG-like [Salvia divinorum]|uniref:3-oxoacyl-[acyl-carrier-protein] reductase FabG-like n=1 Tax=Salvia divinorum TaxID=28513 RepID=A0ABD1FI64_SALDI